MKGSRVLTEFIIRPPPNESISPHKKDLKSGVALVGFTDYNLFKQHVNKIIHEEWKLESFFIISGGARGTDALAEQYAKEYDIPIIIYKPDWKGEGKKAGIMMNSDIIEAADYCIAFPSEKGKGTQDSIKKAEKKKIPIKVVWV